MDHYIVEPEQMAGTDNPFDPAYLGGQRPDPSILPRLPLGPDKVIARRAAAEVRTGRTSIFGFGASSDAPGRAAVMARTRVVSGSELSPA